MTPISIIIVTGVKKTKLQLACIEISARSLTMYLSQITFQDLAKTFNTDTPAYTKCANVFEESKNESIRNTNFFPNVVMLRQSDGSIRTMCEDRQTNPNKRVTWLMLPTLPAHVRHYRLPLLSLVVIV